MRRRDTRGGAVERTANQTALPAIATPTSHVPDSIAMRRHSGGRGAIVAELPGAVADATSARSSRTNCATEMSAMRCRPSFSRHRRISVRTAAGTVAGSAAQSGSPRSTAASVSPTCSPSNARVPVSISYSTQPNAQMSVRLSDRLAARLLRAHVGRRAEDHPCTVSAGHRWRLREVATTVAPGSGSITLARPKSSTFTAAVAAGP